MTTKNNSRNKSKNTKSTKKKKNTTKNKVVRSKKKRFLTMIVIFLIGLLFIFSTYAWLSTSLNVKIKNFKMVVSRNSGLTISLDGINFSTSIEVSHDILIDQLKNTYPNNVSQWASNGLIPVSTSGIFTPNDDKFTVFGSSGVRYRVKAKDIGYIYTGIIKEENRAEFNSFIAFDLFLKNDSGSPVADNIYFDNDTFIELESDALEELDDEASKEIEALVNSARIGILKLDSVSKKASVNEIQNISCNNKCSAIIFEPNSKKHNDLSIEKALKYSLNLHDGEAFPTYSCIKAGGPIYVKDTVSGSINLDYNYFQLQNTITEEDFPNPIFQAPDGITKLRIYIWIEGQDIDSLETDSKGADVSLSISLTKDTVGYEEFNY